MVSYQTLADTSMALGKSYLSAGKGHLKFFLKITKSVNAVLKIKYGSTQVGVLSNFRCDIESRTFWVTEEPPPHTN